MRIILLCAGKGGRAQYLTKNTPKVLLDLGNGQTLIEHNIMAMEESGVVKDLVIVHGYLAEQIEAKLYNYNGLDIEYVYNPCYEVAGLLVSVWAARDHLTDSCLIINGDVFIRDSFLVSLFTAMQNVGDNRIFKAWHQDKAGEPNSGYAGLTAIKGVRALGAYKAALQGVLRRPGGIHLPYHSDLLRTVQHFVGPSMVALYETSYEECRDIDTPEDWAKVKGALADEGVRTSERLRQRN